MAQVSAPNRPREFSRLPCEWRGRYFEPTPRRGEVLARIWRQVEGAADGHSARHSILVVVVVVVRSLTTVAAAVAAVAATAGTPVATVATAVAVAAAVATAVAAVATVVLPAAAAAAAALTFPAATTTSPSSTTAAAPAAPAAGNERSLTLGRTRLSIFHRSGCQPLRTRGARSKRVRGSVQDQRECFVVANDRLDSIAVSTRHHRSLW